MNLEAAFLYGLSINKRVGEYRRDGFDSLPFSYSISNYARNMAVVEDMVTDGREFVFSKEEFDKLYLENPAYPKRGDVIIDTDMGELVIGEIIEQVIMGKLVGYRVRTK